jgi:hypothetical protein
MQGVAAKNEASYDLSRACAPMIGQSTIAACGDDVPAERPHRDGPLCGTLDLSAFLQVNTLTRVDGLVGEPCSNETLKLTKAPGKFVSLAIPGCLRSFASR